jgi:hypothetical protein
MLLLCILLLCILVPLVFILILILSRRRCQAAEPFSSSARLDREMSVLENIVTNASAAGRRTRLQCLLNRINYGAANDTYLIHSIVKFLERKGYRSVDGGDWNREKEGIRQYFGENRFEEEVDSLPPDARFVQAKAAAAATGSQTLAREIDLETTSDYLQDLRNIEIKLIDASFEDRNLLREEVVKTYNLNEVLPLGSYTTQDIAVNRGTGQYEELAPRATRSLGWQCQRDWYDCQGSASASASALAMRSTT